MIYFSCSLHVTGFLTNGKKEKFMYCVVNIYVILCWQGAFWGLMAGFVTGMARMVVDFYYGEPACHEEDHRPEFLQRASVHSILVKSYSLLLYSFMSDVHFYFYYSLFFF